MTYKEANKVLKKHGCGRAEGDALRAMYAKLIPFTVGISTKTAKRFYSHLQNTPDSAIHTESRRLMKDTYAAAMIAIGEQPELPDRNLKEQA